MRIATILAPGLRLVALGDLPQLILCRILLENPLPRLEARETRIAVCGVEPFPVAPQFAGKMERFVDVPAEQTVIPAHPSDGITVR